MGRFMSPDPVGGHYEDPQTLNRYAYVTNKLDFYYNDDPRICRTDSKHASFLSLQDLASRHPDHHLVIFGDGSGLINRFTGEAEQWLEIFSPWPGRALMTPESPAHWSYREWVLADLDFAVLPASTGGLAALLSLEALRRIRH